MTTPHFERPLYAAITTLAGSPDDISGIDEMLVRIASLTVASVAAVDYASITAQRDGAPTTVALSNETALAIDEAQYSDEAGPCLDALASGIPISVNIATTMIWPGFREAATGLGVQASLSIPLFAGAGQPIAALNLYARNDDALAPLSAALLTVFDFYNNDRPARGGQPGIVQLHGDAGSTELLAGIAEALAVQNRIQVAIGVLMQRHSISATRAYVTLRENAAQTGRSLPEAAAEVADRLSLDE
jgi:hypothetical protein